MNARLRATPEDFVVDEVLGFEADGSGEHVLLKVRKRGANTDWVARELARFADVPPVAVGYAGLKDRDAVTTQTFSLQLPADREPDWRTFPHDDVSVLEARRHRRKLKRGALSANAFRIVLREVEGDRQQAQACLERIATRGVPNYFGEQRFGRGGRNVERAEAMFAGRRVDRPTRSLLLSAARSQVFNELLAARVEADCWDRPLDGEIWCLAGSRAWFGPEPWNDPLAERLASGDIHPSGPLWGRGALPGDAAAAELERRVAQAHPALCQGLEAAGLEQDRRPLRLIPQALRWQWLDPQSLELAFSLPPGCYATTLIRELAVA